MSNYALICLIGHVGRCDELKFVGANNTPVLKFSLAVNTGYGEKKTCSWYSCQLWGKQAETLVQYVTKGKALLVSGEPSIRDWESNGKRGTSVEIRVESVTLLGGKNETEKGNSEPDAVQGGNGDEVPF